MFNSAMRTQWKCVFAVLALLGVGPLFAEDLDGDPDPQVVLPVENQTLRDDGEVYVPPSATTPLPLGARVDFGSDFQVAMTPFAVQRLTQRTYFVETNLYASTVYVGDHGVLVIDCGGHGGPAEAQALLDAVASITPLPVTHLVYSHAHTDHVGNSVYLKQLLPSLEIIASRWAAQQIEMYGYPIAEPTRRVFLRRGGFFFNGQWFRMVTPVPVAHTPADSYIVTPDRVLHAVDFVHADRLSFIEASVVQNLDGFILFLRHLAGEADNYDYMNPGHLNVAYPRDVDRALGYYQALYGAWWETIQETQVPDFVTPLEDNAAIWLRNFFDAVAEKMFFKVAPAFGHVRFFEVARDHAQKVHENQFLHRLNLSDPTSFGSMPSFEPIPPPAGE